jgi:hypothetical protein
MRESHKERPHFNITDDVDLVEYRTISPLAVVAFVLSLLTPVAFLSSVLLLFPLIVVLVSGIALWRIKSRAPVFLGKKLAGFALFLSLAVAVAAPCDWFVYRMILRREARAFGELFIDYVRRGEPQKAYQLTLAPGLRRSLDNVPLEEFSEKSARRALETFLGGDAVHAILTVGKNAEVRYYDTESQGEEGTADQVFQSYAVTYSSEGETKTFFVGLVLERKSEPKVGRSFWYVTRQTAPVHPKALSRS